MKRFLDQNFLLNSTTAERLYHVYANDMPLIDYHCHLDPALMAADSNFKNLTEAWLKGDHYKWRAMRACGVEEAFITGGRTDREKFEKWAATVPYTLRNPLYHWTHLELKRYFDINELLSPASAERIYDECSEKLQSPEFTIRNLINRMNVEVICTTDDPLDTLEHHQQIRQSNWNVKVLPTFRPDRAMNTDNLAALNDYINQLEAVSNISIHNFSSYTDALKNRHDYFAQNGCKVSDHGLEHLYAEVYTQAEINAIFDKLRLGKEIDQFEKQQFKSALLYELALLDHDKGWVQQFHLGALRNNNSRGYREAGADAGYDSIGDFTQAQALSAFLNRLDDTNQLAKTIIYNLNPSDNEMIATMAGNFNDGSSAGKIQFGSAWWFLDQKEGMTRQLNALSAMGLVSKMVGMLTDSRSFLSFPRHEYFRRILCNLFGEDIENGELPDDLEFTGQVIRDICYYNAQNYFKF